MFDFGQAYVALSRATSLEGLYLESYNKQAIKAHEKVSLVLVINWSCLFLFFYFYFYFYFYCSIIMVIIIIISYYCRYYYYCIIIFLKYYYDQYYSQSSFFLQVKVFYESMLNVDSGGR